MPVEWIRIPDTQFNLVWSGLLQKSYRVGIYLDLLPDVPSELIARIDRVHVRVQVAGLVWKQVFLSRQNLSWAVYWERRDLYDRDVVGLARLRGIKFSLIFSEIQKFYSGFTHL